MVRAAITFHIPQEAEPGRVLPFLEAMCAEQARFPTVSALLGYARERGLTARTELQIVASACGLLEKDASGWIVLSTSARTIMRLKPDARPDLIHYLLYSAWQAENPSARAFLWSYRKVIDCLWMRAPVDVVSIANVIAEEINNHAQETFPGSVVSFSPKSVRGVRKWLGALTPPVIKDNIVAKRYFCPPEALMLASAWVARMHGGEVGIDFLLTAQRREAMCRLCMLDMSILDRMLDRMLLAYPRLVRPGTGAGVYGRFLRFLKWPDMVDLLDRA